LVPACALTNLYGPTEATIDVSYFDCPKEIDQVPIGKPIANTQLYVLDEQGNHQPIGIPGELHIGGVQLARGYLNREQLTKEKFIDTKHGKLYRTGDLAKWLPDGNIAYLGRIDNQIKLRGYRIELSEIESVLEEQQDISQAIVVVSNQQLIAYVTAEDNFDKAVALAALRQRLPEYMIPATITQLESMPLTGSGKADRKHLQSLEVQLSGANAYQAPTTETETMLVSIWEELLPAKTIGINDNFFELGGHSLLAMRVNAHLKKKLDLSVPMQVFFQLTTIRELSRYIEVQLAQNTSASKEEEAFEFLNI
jgi:acyl carrier protein